MLLDTDAFRKSSHLIMVISNSLKKDNSIIAWEDRFQENPKIFLSA
jgi:hypothetical protein